MDTIQLLWQRIEAWMNAQAPRSRQKLLPGASEMEIQLAETTMGCIFPEDFKASYRLHNGGYTIDMVTEMDILSLKDIIAEWLMLKELAEIGTWSDRVPYYFTGKVVQSGWQTGPIQPFWWNLHWIPFGRDRAGNVCCLDLTPAIGGIIGQIIDWDHEVGPSRVLASSILELLSTFVNDLEAGVYVDTGDGLTHQS